MRHTPWRTAASPGFFLWFAVVSDLHVWAMGTSEIALTAHLVMPEGAGDDAFLAHATQALHERFEIRHVTLQLTRAPLGQGCQPLADRASGRGL